MDSSHLISWLLKDSVISLLNLMVPVAPFILTIDVGTSSTRAILYDALARPVPGCIAQISNRLQTADDGRATFDANQLQQHAVTVIDRVLREAGSFAEQIAAVAMDTFVSNVLGTDGLGRPVTPVYTYADIRNAPDAKILRLELGAQGMADAHDRAGALIHTSYLPARFRWLKRTQPEILDQVHRWLSIGEFLLWHFCGERRCSYSVASWTGLLNRRKLTWDAEWLDRLPLDAEQLSPLGDVTDPLIGLQAEWAERWPSLSNVPWIPPIGDGAAANVGSGCGSFDHKNHRRVALTVGTTGAMRVVIDAEKAAQTPVPDGLWLYRVTAQRGLLGGATTEGGNVYAWLQSTLQLPSADELEHALQERAPAAHGLTVLPFVAGERAPGWDDDARASIVGFSLSTDPLDIVQACQEGIAYRFAQIYQRIASALSATESESEPKILANGGAILSSPAWMQIFADVLNRPITALEEDETTSRGLALLALEGLGVIGDVQELEPQMGRTFEPDPERHAIHQEALERQAQIYGKLREI